MDSVDKNYNYFVTNIREVLNIESIIILIVCFIFFCVLFLSISLFGTSGGIFVCILILGCGIALPVSLSIKNMEKQRLKELESFKTKMGIPQDNGAVLLYSLDVDVIKWNLIILNGHKPVNVNALKRVAFSKKVLFTWIENEKLIFCVGSGLKPSDEEYHYAFCSKIHVDRIKCFYKKMNSMQEDFLERDASTNEFKIDFRDVILIIEDECTNELKWLTFNSEAYEVFIRLIPEK